MKSIVTVAVLMALLASQSTSADQGRAAEVPEVMLPEFSAERVEKGKKMYKQLCLRCHGPEMNGGNNAYDLRIFPLEQRERFFNSVLNGKRAMPPWKGVLSEEEIGNLWAYVGTRGGTIQR
jgi:mono/diheme cytochrome c family protein